MILDDLAAFARERVEQDKKKTSLAEMKKQAKAMEKGDFPFEKALQKDDLSFICEIKKASPSKGLIAKEFDPLQIAAEYEDAGADAISVLTEPKWFLGSDEILKEVAARSGLPILRKDFTVDEYQIYQAKVLGADAVLLIAAILSDQQLQDYIALAHSLGLSALAEAHDEEEIQRVLKAGARIVGVNNRNLKDFSMNFENARSLRSAIPQDVLFISESGVRTAQDIAAVKDMQADGVLIGETLMKAGNKKEQLTALKQGAAHAA